MRKSNRLSITLFALLSGIPVFAGADTLLDVIQSEEMENYEDKTASNEEKQYFPPNSNRSAIFRPSGARKLGEWIETYTPGFYKQGETYDKGEEVVWSRKTYQSDDQTVFDVTVMVPHPKFLNTVEAGLATEMNQYEPPTLKIESAEKIDIKQVPGTLYFRKDGSCSILLKIAQNGIVNVQTPSCQKADQLIKLTEMLDLRRLQDKLNS